MRGFETISWVLPGVLPGGDDVLVALAGPDERAAVGDAVVATYLTAAGPFRVAVDPALGPLLPDVLAAGTETVPAADRRYSSGGGTAAVPSARWPAPAAVPTPRCSPTPSRPGGAGTPSGSPRAAEC